MSTALASRRWKGLALIAAAQFMVIMDTSIIGVALPKMQADLGFSQENLSWVFNAYVVAFGGLLLLGGRLSDLFGARRCSASAGWCCWPARWSPDSPAASQSSWPAAAIQGAGAALIAPSALTLLMMLFGSEPRELTKALALYGAAAPAGGTAGVFLGGVITEYLSWPWVFFLNIPIAVVAVAATGLMPAGAGARRGPWTCGVRSPSPPASAPPSTGSSAPPRSAGPVQTWRSLGRGRRCSAAFVVIQAPRRNHWCGCRSSAPRTWPPRTWRSSCSARPGSRCGSS